MLRPLHVLLATLALILLPQGLGLNALAAPVASPTAVVIVDGKRLPATLGRILKIGQPLPGGRCGGVDHIIEVRLPDPYVYFKVGVEVAEGCVLRVIEVEFRREAARGAPGWMAYLPGSRAAAGALRRSWAHHYLHEQFHFATTEVYESFDYLENPDSTVDNAFAVEGWCGTPGVGWTVQECYNNFLDWGPYQIKRFQYGSFVNSCCAEYNNIRHSLRAESTAWYGGGTYTCGPVGTPGNLLAFWHDHCEGGRL